MLYDMSILHNIYIYWGCTEACNGNFIDRTELLSSVYAPNFSSFRLINCSSDI